MALWLNFPFCSLLTAMVSWHGLKNRLVLLTDGYNKENQAVSVLLSPTHYIPKNEQRSFNRGYLFLQSIISSLRFDNICRNIKRRHQYEYNLYDIFSDLLFARILHPSSKKNSYAFAQTLLEQPNTFSKTSIAPFLLLPMNQIISRLRSIVIHISFINGIPRSFIMTVQTIILK